MTPNNFSFVLLNESSINTFGHDTALDVVVDGNAIEAWDTAHGVKPAATKATAKLIGRNTSTFKVDLSLQLLLQQKSIPVVLYTLEIAGEDDIFVPHASSPLLLHALDRKLGQQTEQFPGHTGPRIPLVAAQRHNSYPPSPAGLHVLAVGSRFGRL